MKRKEESDYHKSIYTGTLYLEEIEAILELAESQGFEVQLSDKTYIYTDLEELIKENPQGINTLEIQVEKPEKYAYNKAYISTKDHWTTITLTSSTPELHTFTRMVQELLSDLGWKQKLLPHAPNIVFIASAVSFFSWVAFALLISLSGRMFLPLPLIALSIVTLVIFIASVLLRSGKSVKTEHRRKVVGFWARYGRELFFAFLGAGLTVVAGLIVYYLTR